MKASLAVGKAVLTLSFLGPQISGQKATGSIEESRNLVASSTEEMFLVCGDPDRNDSDSNCRVNGEWKSYISGNVEEEHAVRCCVDNKNLGLYEEKDMCEGPLGISYIKTGNENLCYKTSTYNDAVDLCESQGARLCSVWEVLDHCTQSSGCSFDLEYVWTSTPFADPIPRDPSIPVSDGTHYVTCGDPDRSTATDCITDGAFLMSRPAFDMEEHEVRCCSDSKLPWSMAKEMCDGVWGGTDMALAGEPEKCFASKNYLQAKDICEQAGARLCTVWEVQNHCTQSTGCGFDNHYVWTSTEVVDPDGPVPRDPSIPFSDAEHLLVCGDPDRNSDGCKRDGVLESPVAGHDMEQHAVRCCSDKKLDLPWATSTCVDSNGVGVWGITNMALAGEPDKCFSAKNYLQAKEVCEQAGTRLCTAEEAMNSCTQGSGCGYDAYYFWTETTAEEGYAPPTAAPTVPIEQFETDHWVVCGDPDRTDSSGCRDKNGDFHATFQADGMEKHEVRCCSDGKLDWMNDGWAKNNAEFCGNVWGASFINGVCYENATYGEAKRICEDNGARLCTQVELANSCAQGSGCQHDIDWVWSSTEVIEGIELPDSNDFHYGACGNPTRTSAPLCQKDGKFYASMSVNDGEDLAVRCCSETELPFFSNSPVRKQNGCSVYGISEIPIIGGSIANTVCMAAKTHWEAESICAQNGARLCTVEEVVQGCSRGSGCGYDAHMVWTRTPSCATEKDCEGERHVDKHLGCFKDTRGDARFVFNLGSPFSIDSCYESCHSAGYGYFGIKEGGTCYCGDTLDMPKNIEQGNCDRPCSIGGYGGCGGKDSVDLYATGIEPNAVDNYESRYVGCFKDDVKALTMLETDTGKDSSIKTCVDECSAHPAGYAVAAMTNSSQCLCGKSLLEGRSTDCKMPCKNGKGLCGGVRGRSLYMTTNEVRPLQRLLECRGARSSWWGDPHLTTFDGLKYDCQGIGHFILTECKDYQLQAMFKAATGSHNKASVTDGIAATYRSYPKVQVSIADFESEYTNIVNGCPVHVFVGGQLVNQTAGIIHPEVNIKLSGPGFDIQFPASGPALRVKVRKGRGCLVDVDTCIPSDCQDTAMGLLGTPNNNMEDEWMTRSGEPIWPRPNNYRWKGGFDYCTKEWCVQNLGDSLFTYGPGKSFDDYDECAAEFPGEVNTEDLPEDIKEECSKSVDKTGCLIEAAIGGREAVEETLDNELDTTDVPGDEDNDEWIDDPNPPFCPDDIQLIGQIGPDIENWPVKVLDYGTTEVKLEIKSPLRVSQVADFLHVQYPKGQGVAIESCEGFTEVDKRFTTVVEVECMHSSPYAMVHVFVSDATAFGENDHADAKIFPCCHAPPAALEQSTAQYTFAVSCVKRCPEEFYAIA